jgi:hypothetical protein
MPRYRKRQKKETKTQQLEGTEIVNGWEGEKDEEELQLESTLFGKPNAASILNDVKLPSFDDSEDPDDVRDTSVWQNASFATTCDLGLTDEKVVLLRQWIKITSGAHPHRLRRRSGCIG